jgi:quinol monooxygenase YgiN
MLTVIAQYRTQPGRGDEVAEVLVRHAATTRTEPGCLRFDACRSLDDPDRFVLYEQYTDDEAFEAHHTSEHFRANIDGVIAGLLAERTFSRYTQL